MYIKEIELKDFRNYEDLNIQFHENVNIFLGANAQGKTNLLESLYLTSMGKSFRTGRDRDMIRFGRDFFRIKVIAYKDGEELTVEMAVNQEGKKGIKIDGVKASKISQLFEHIYAVIFSPEDLRIVKDEPEKRRRFIDRELCQIRPSYYSALHNYKKVLIQRNACLKELKTDELLLDILDDKLAEYGSRVILQRDAFIKKLGRISREIHGRITHHKEELDIFYEPDIEVLPAEELVKKFSALLKKNRPADIQHRTTGKGPHKDDLKIMANGTDMRKFGSQGQQRTAALSLKLSEIELIKEETGEDPILLLDDVLSELDQERQNDLIHSLSHIQVFITATGISRQAAGQLGDIQYLHVKDGKIFVEKND